MATIPGVTASGGRETEGAATLANNAIGLFTATLQSAGMAISMAALIFAGPLALGLPRAITSFVIGVGISSIIIGLRSQIAPLTVISQDAPAIVLVAVAAQVSAEADNPQVSDVFVLLVLTTLLTGLAMWLMGKLHFGGMVRYLPTTVIGAFMAGTGWLLFKGGLDVIVGFGIGPSDIGDLFTSDLAKFWVPGVAIGLLVWQVSRSDRLPPYAVGVTIVVCLSAFYAVVALFSSFDAVESGGWLIGPFPDKAGIELVSLTELRDARWGNLFGSASGILSALGVAVVVLLLNITGIGTEVDDRLDVDRELRASGLANVVVAPFGLVPSFHALADTLLLKRLGATQQLIPVVAGGLLIALGVLGVSAIGYVPRIVVGALLITVGVSLLDGWIRDMARSISTTERLLSAGILLIIATVGVLEGIGAGLAAACVLFIIRYSRVDPVREVSSGHGLRSRVDRNPAERQTLASRADDILVFELQGYLFFGSLTALDDQVSLAVEERDEPLDVVLIDFKHVTGVDVSAYALIGRLATELSEQGTNVIFSELDDNLREAFIATTPELTRHVTIAETLDDAVELVEESQLSAAMSGEVIAPDDVLMSDALAAAFTDISFEAGTVVMEQDTESDGMLILTEGHMTFFQVDDAGARRRLRRSGPSTMVGEIGMITGSPRTVEVVADTDTSAMWLSLERYDDLRRNQPDLIFELHELIMQVQSARVVELGEALARSLR